MTAATIGATAHTTIRRDSIRCSPGAMIGGVHETIESAQGQNLTNWRTAMSCHRATEHAVIVIAIFALSFVDESAGRTHVRFRSAL